MKSASGPEFAVVSGVGCACALGFDEGQMTKQSARGLDLVERDLDAPRAGKSMSRSARFLPQFDANDFAPNLRLRHVNRESQLWLSVTAIAIRDAGLDLSGWDPLRVGMCVGTLTTGLHDYTSLYAKALQDGLETVRPTQGPQTGFNAAAAQVSILLGTLGPSFTFSSGTTAALDAIAYGASLVLSHRVDYVVAGGIDVISTLEVYEESRGRSGVLLGEGAAALVIERRETAVARGACIRCEVQGYATTGFLSSSEDGAAAIGNAATRALAAAGASPTGLSVVVLDANGSPEHDDLEQRGIDHLALPERTAFVSPKAATGDCFAASGSLAIPFGLAATRLRHRSEPTIGHSVRRGLVAPSLTTEHFLVHALDPAGQSSSLVLGVTNDE